MVHGEARVFIKRPVGEVTDFIMDLREYQKVDAKLGKIYELNRTGDTVVFTFRPRLLGLPGPKTTQKVVLTPGRRIDVVGTPSPMDKMMKFSAFFEFEEEQGGTWVRRRLDFDFAKPASWLLHPLLGRWLPGDVAKELALAKQRLEA